MLCMQIDDIFKVCDTSIRGLNSIFSSILIFPLGSKFALCATKLWDSQIVDSAVKCINFPSSESYFIFPWIDNKTF